ncbi:hypothetical protein HanXRQr2_Chr01g0000201 [Helianthus annuus]|uniref:Uncharacterized protein n=1 Tax=Helianthus annuus TaxID=4232 RepID=A0A251VJI8_HELAN|nr:hypothetical protein HanXRQr2_Chr01g0000201 [Helianthus annuus]
MEKDSCSYNFTCQLGDGGVITGQRHLRVEVGLQWGFCRSSRVCGGADLVWQVHTTFSRETSRVIAANTAVRRRSTLETVTNGLTVRSGSSLVPKSFNPITTPRWRIPTVP